MKKLNVKAVVLDDFTAEEVVDFIDSAVFSSEVRESSGSGSGIGSGIRVQEIGEVEKSA